MNRRDFVRIGGAAGALAASGCLPRATATRRSAVVATRLIPPEVSWDRIIRTTVGHRPYRPSGFVLRAERLDGKTLVHNFGHGGSGWSLSWGTGVLAADLALEQPERRAAVIGCGAVGLTTARQLQRRGFEVTIYAADLPPNTTSNMSWAGFTPNSGLVAAASRTPAWDAQFRRAVEIAYREHQLLVGRGYGVSWIDEYTPTNNAPGQGGRAAGGAAPGAAAVPPPGAAAAAPPGPAGAGGRAGPPPPPLLPTTVQTGAVLLQPGQHPFATTYARRQPTLRFEPSIYLEAIMKDVLAFGGKIVVRKFATPRDLTALSEPVIVNCTGLGSRELFGDREITPVKGQLVVLIPQPEVTYACAGMMPRSDGLVLGHVMLSGDGSLEINEAERRRVMEAHLRTFSTMRAMAVERVPTPANPPPDPGVAVTGSPTSVPPVESFFDRES